MEVSDHNKHLLQDSSSSNGFVKGKLSFEWKHISVSVDPTKKNPFPENIVTDLNGKLVTGQSLAIFGPSGSGKTTFLNTLSVKVKMRNMTQSGDIYINNEVVTSASEINSLISYVTQDDILDEDLTPNEILLFCAKMKLSSSTKVVEKRVRELVDLLSLQRCQNNRVGGINSKGISGGEKKRVCIAAELISDCPILILDEPTTGLDSETAYELMETLNNIRLKGKIVIFTIHQPASEIFELLDNILLISKGRQIFTGSKEYLSDHFKRRNLPIPNSYNPFEYIIELANKTALNNCYVEEAYPNLKLIENKNEAFDEYLNILAGSQTKRSIDPAVPNSNSITNLIDYERDEARSVFVQVYLIFLKLLIISVRNPRFLRFRLVQLTIYGVIKVIFFYDLPHTEDGTKYKLGLLNFISICLILSATTSVVLSSKCQII